MNQSSLYLLNHAYIMPHIICKMHYMTRIFWELRSMIKSLWSVKRAPWLAPLGIIFMWFFGVLPLTSSISTIMHRTPIAFMMLSSFKWIVNGAITLDVSNATRWGVTCSANPESMIYLQKCILCCIINL